MVGADSGDAASSAALARAPIAATLTNHAMPNALDRIVSRKRLEVAAKKRSVPVESLKERIAELGRPRNFFQAVVDHGSTKGTRVIAEVKQRSPSGGLIRPDFNPVDIARRYHANGAVAISCLTDEVDFGGSLDFIHAIRDAVPLPVLRKDFIIESYQVWEARAFGADAILLIAECLSDAQLIDYKILAIELGMSVLVEVHDTESLYRVQPHLSFPHSGYALLGVNNRDLRTMTTDLGHSFRMAELVDDTHVMVSESGIRTPDDLKRLRAHGIHIVLVGEHLLRQPDPGTALAELLGREPREPSSR
jgi:indole-3-glycerol phosphate synthase